jgi:hypothetical protein
MPAAATGIFKQVAIKREVTYGTAPAAASAQLLRRVTSQIDLKKDTFQSNEIRPDFQIADFRHGTRRVKGTLNGELSPGTYSDMFGAMLKRDFVAGASTAGASITVAGSGPTYTLTRAAGSFLTDGFKVGHVLRLSVGTFNAANANNNLLITALTAAVATVQTLNNSALVPEGPIASATVAVQGKTTYIPLTGHTDVSYSLEHWFNDIGRSELFTGVKMDKVAINLPPTGMATAAFDVVGQNMTPALARYFTSPNAITSSGTTAAVNGLLLVNGVPQAIVTGLSLSIDPTFSGDPVVGANVVPNQFAGPVNVTGQFTAYFTDTTLRDLFINETETTLMVVLTTNNTNNADFVAFTLPRIKLNDAAKNDGTGGVVQTFPFQALMNIYGGVGQSSEATTVLIQDTLA